MFAKESPNEYKIRINRVVNFILQNLMEDLSLKKLAQIANYSPFHFQKIFKSVVGESPKQYVNRVRLETAAHTLVILREKPITEIAFDNGFSSSATFARSFKNYFGVSSEKFRIASSNRQIIHFQNDKSSFVETANIEIKKTLPLCGIFVNAKLDDDKAIQMAFQKVIQLAEINNLLTSKSQFVGIIYLHSNIYRAMITINSDMAVSKKLNILGIPGGKFATLDSYINSSERIPKLKIFAEFWLPKSGYQISDIVGYEILEESPIKEPFNKIKKKIYIPIKPIS
ncbi:MAG: AraC family transcriptional regulator [Blastocatellia bacterium]|nr:AraC family transcriptional regulator [Blastocatellia bacterium]